MSDATARRRRCPHCGARPTWQYIDPHWPNWIGFCDPCGWIGRAHTVVPAGPSQPALVAFVSEVGGPGDVPVPNPWAGIYRLAQQASPRVTWDPGSAPCRACGADAVVSGVRDNGTQRYEFDLCLSCGEVLVRRMLAATPGLVRLDAGNVGRDPTSPGVRWLVRGLGFDGGDSSGHEQRERFVRRTNLGEDDIRERGDRVRVQVANLVDLLRAGRETEDGDSPAVELSVWGHGASHSHADTIALTLQHVRKSRRNAAVIVSGEGGEAYVQMLVRTSSPDSLYGEAVDPDAFGVGHLDDSKRRTLRNQGWRAPSRFGSPNFTKSWDLEKTTLGDVGQDLASALRIVSGISVTEDLVVEILVPATLSFWATLMSLARGALRPRGPRTDDEDNDERGSTGDDYPTGVRI